MSKSAIEKGSESMEQNNLHEDKGKINPETVQTIESLGGLMRVLYELEGAAEQMVDFYFQNGVIKSVRRGAYIMDVGGYTALLPKFWYEWDESKRNDGVPGEEFPVLIMPSRLTDRILVSRCHLTDNPNTPSNLLIEKGAILRATVAFVRSGRVMADVYPGFRMSVHPAVLRELPRRGDQVTIRVLGRNTLGNYYGLMLDLDHQRKDA